MKILHLSDTHGKHRSIHDLATADIIVHSGDLTFAGSENEIIDFIEWFTSLPYKYKIFIAGNHDDYLFGADIEGMGDNCFYLCNSGVTIERVTFYGIPMFMEDVLSGEYDKYFRQIPEETDVLITHQPPYCILDSSAGINYGSRELLEKVLAVQPKHHLFGHIHNAYGIEHNNETLFSNASIMNEYYDVSNKPILLEV